MPGFLLHELALIDCPHMIGTATPDQVDAHVKLSGMALMTLGRTYTIGHCTANSPCTKAHWNTGAPRITAGGLVVAINTGVSLVEPAGALVPLVFQQRVKAG